MSVAPFLFSGRPFLDGWHNLDGLVANRARGRHRCRGNGAVGAKESEIDECPEDRKVIAYLEHGVDGVVGADNVASRCVDPVF